MGAATTGDEVRFDMNGTEYTGTVVEILEAGWLDVSVDDSDIAVFLNSRTGALE